MKKQRLNQWQPSATAEKHFCDNLLALFSENRIAPVTNKATLVRDRFIKPQSGSSRANHSLAEDSSQSGGDSPQSTRYSPQCSPHFPPKLLALAELARRRAKLATAEMRKLIATVCAGRWLTTKELGALLDRDADNLQRRLLTALVREGKLELRFPDVPNRPDQAYRTKEA